MKVQLFSSASCPPCKRFAPIWEQLKSENPEVEFIKHSAEEDIKAFMDAGIGSVPTILVGETVLVGMQSKEKVQDLINGG